MSLDRLGGPGADIWHYWSSCRRGDLVPHRRDFDPMAIARHLPIVSLIERTGPLAWRLRVVGTEIARRSGEFTGRNYIELLVPEQREREHGRLSALVDQPCGSLSMRQNVRSGISYPVRCVALPLRAVDGEVRLLITTNEELAQRRFSPEIGLDVLDVGDREYLDIGAGVPEAMP